MTAEVAIVNSYAVAIAADSGVTIGRGKKIYNRLQRTALRAAAKPER